MIRDLHRVYDILAILRCFAAVVLGVALSQALDSGWWIIAAVAGALWWEAAP